MANGHEHPALADVCGLYSFIYKTHMHRFLRILRAHSLIRSQHPARASRASRGFTLIEILVVIGMLAILSTIVLIAVNPLRQFAQARNAQRQNDVTAILNGISERIADNGGNFQNPDDPTCPALPATAMNITDDASNPASVQLRSCIVPTYLAEAPFDPVSGSNSCTDATCSGKHYNLGYTVQQDATTHRVTVCAPGGVESAIPHSVPICLTR